MRALAVGRLSPEEETYVLEAEDVTGYLSPNSVPNLHWGSSRLEFGIQNEQKVACPEHWLSLRRRQLFFRGDN